jgi:hypothetical protein
MAVSVHHRERIIRQRPAGLNGMATTPGTSALADEPTAEIVVPEDASSVAPVNYLLPSWFCELDPATNGIYLKPNYKSSTEK